MSNVARLRKELAKAQAKSLKCAERRHALPPGSSRARVTTANANWARAAEHRDRISDMLDAAIAEESAACPCAATSECTCHRMHITERCGCSMCSNPGETL